MRITHVINGLDDGGAEAVLYRLCQADREHEHAVISLQDDGKYGALLRGLGVSVDAIGLRRGRVTPHGMRHLTRLLRRLRPEVVQTWMYHANLIGGIAARLAGRQRVVWGMHNTSLSVASTAWTTRAAARLGGPASRVLAEGIIYCAQRSREIHEGLAYAPGKGVVIPNGYDVSEFRPDAERGRAWRQAAGVPTDRPVIGMVGRFDPQKDHRNLVEAVAFAARSGAPFDVALVGHRIEPGNAELRGWITEQGLDDRFHLLGRSSDIPAVMNGLDVHVLSSRFGEAFPNVVCESMACGTPNVVTDVGDAGLIVDDTGWVVPPGDPAALAHALCLALREQQSTREHWERRRALARERIVQHFSIERMVDSYASVWRSVARGGSV